MPRAIPAVLVVAVLATGIGGLFVVARPEEGDPAMPTRTSAVGELAGRLAADYDRPRPADSRALASAFNALAAGERARAAALARRVGYRAAGSGSEVVLVPGARNRGWGLFAHTVETEADVVVEVPHPRSDLDTEDLGVRLFAELGAHALLVAGAHRDVVDVADEPSSPFAVVSASLARPGRIFVQLHGFDERDHDVGDAVISSGKADPDPAAARVASALRGAGYGVCLYAGRGCGSLAGRTNVQRRAAQARGSEFVHVELARDLRDTKRDRARVTAAIASALGAAAAR